MGSTPRAKLAYGYDLGGTESDWKVQGVDEYESWRPTWLAQPDDEEDEDGGELTEVAERLLLTSIGFTETDWRADGYFERKRAAEGQVGVEFTFSGHSDYAGTLLVARGSRKSVEWSETMALDPTDLIVRPNRELWDTKLAEALQVLDFTPTQDGPRWLVFPTYG